MDISKAPEGATHYGEARGIWTPAWYKLESCGQWLVYNRYYEKWQLHIKGNRPVDELNKIEEKESKMKLSDVEPRITTTYEFTVEQINGLIAKELDIDMKNVKVRVSYITDYQGSVNKVQVVIN